MTIENVDIERVIQDILLHELGLPISYGQDKDGFIIPSVYVVAPNISLGKTDLLQIGIKSIGSQIVANDNRSEEGVAVIEGESVSVLNEVSEIVLNDNIQIDIKSRNDDARIRRFEVLAALKSTYSKQQQAAHNCKIFQIPRGFINTMGAEGPSSIYRWTTTICTQYGRIYTKQIDYYDTFPVSTTNEVSSNAVVGDDFTILPEGD